MWGGCARSAGVFLLWHHGWAEGEKATIDALEAENAKLKKMLAEQMMDVATLKEMLGKNF